MSDAKQNAQTAPKDAKQNAKKPALPDAEFNKTWDQEKNYKFVKRFNDPRFGEITVVKNPATNHVLMVKEKMVSGKNEAADDIMNLKSRLSLNHPNMMRMVNYTTSVKKELCSTHYLSRAYYEFPKSDVHKEIMDRKKDLTEFNDRELTHMLYQTAFGLQNLHSKNMVHGDIRPQLIGYDKALNQYQILDRFADPTPLERCQTNNIVNNKELYLGPQLYKKLKGADKKATYNAQKNDVYALGMTLLHAGTQDSMQDNYLPNGTMNHKKLEEHLQELDNKHGARNPVLCQTVRHLLTEDENQRSDVNQLLNNLPPYDQFKQVESQGLVFGNPKVQTRVEQPVEFQQQQTTGDNFEFFDHQKEAPKVQNAPAFEYQTQTHYQPQYTYTTTEPQTITYTRPITHNVYSHPVTQYSYSQPTQYVVTNPVQYNDYSYVSERKVESIPNTTYVSTQDNTHNVSNMRYSHSYLDNSRVQQPTEKVIRYSRNVAPTQVYNTQYVSNQYIPSERIVETRVVNAPETKVYIPETKTEVVTERRSYTAPENRVYTTTYPETRTENRVYTTYPETRVYAPEARTEVVTERRSYVAPETKTESRVYTTYPETRTENRVYTTVPEGRTETRVIRDVSDANYISTHVPTNYYTEQRKSIRFLNAENMHKPISGHTVERTEYRENGNYVVPSTYSNVEVKNGSYTTYNETADRVVKKRYVKRDDGTVVELDADSEVNMDEVRRHLQGN